MVLTDGREYFHQLGSDEKQLFCTMGQLIADGGGFEPVLISEDSLGVVVSYTGASGQDLSGVAEAIAIEEQVRAYGGPRLQLTQQVISRFSQAIETAKIDIVPRVIVGQTGDKSNAFESLLSVLLSEHLGDSVAAGPGASAAAIAIREKLQPRS